MQTFFLRTNKIWLMKKYRGIQMHNFLKIFDCHCTSREKHLLLFQSGQTGQYVYLVLNINISEEKQTLPLWKEISENQCIFQFSTYNFQLKYIITRLLKCLLGLALLKTWGHLYSLTHFISYCDTIHNKNKKLILTQTFDLFCNPTYSYWLTTVRPY